MNFKKIYEADIPESFGEYDTEFPFNIGNDGLGTFSNDRYHQDICIDDFVVFGDALTSDEVTELGKYYGI